MSNDPSNRIRELIERLGRISASEDWQDDLNPTQLAALAYLSRANRFSRAPSQVADYLAATRGTVSQTLKALARKGYVREMRAENDRRWISYEVTGEGRNRINRATTLDAALDALPAKQAAALADGLSVVARHLLKSRNLRPFGICNQCRHFRTRPEGARCALLEIDLQPAETHQICHEQEPA